MQDWWGSESFGQRRLLGLTPLLALGLAETLGLCNAAPLVLARVWAARRSSGCWNRQLAAIYNSETLARRNEAISLDQLAAPRWTPCTARLRRSSHGCRGPVWLLLYDNLKGIWLDEGPRSLEGVIDVGNEPRDLPEVLGHNWYRARARATSPTGARAGGAPGCACPSARPAPSRPSCGPARRWSGEPVEVELELNGRSLGRDRPDSGVGRVRLRGARKRRCAPGSTTWPSSGPPRPARADPEHRGKDAAAAVDWVSFRRTSVEQGPR